MLRSALDHRWRRHHRVLAAHRHPRTQAAKTAKGRGASCDRRTDTFRRKDSGGLRYSSSIAENAL